MLENKLLIGSLYAFIGYLSIKIISEQKWQAVPENIKPKESSHYQNDQ